MKKISPGFLLPSAAYTVKKSAIKLYAFQDRVPQVGDLVYGRIIRIGQHSGLENKNGRIHVINSTAIGTPLITLKATCLSPPSTKSTCWPSRVSWAS